MNENNAARSADWDIAHEIWAAAQTPPGESIVSAVERIVALLSKLRAEGVPVDGMPEYITDNRYHIQYRLGWNNCLSDCRAAMLNAAPVASAPADERAAGINPDKCDTEVYERGTSVGLFAISKEDANTICAGIAAATGARVDWHYVAGRVHIKALPALASAPVADERCCGNADCGWRGTTERMCGSVGPLCPECGETTEASAPVAGEAQRPDEHYAEVKSTLEGAHRIMEGIAAVERRAGPIGSHARGYTHKITNALRHLDALYAAPQASEYERGHAAGWAAGWDQAITQPQADKDGPWCCERGEAQGVQVCQECAEISAGYQASMRGDRGGGQQHAEDARSALTWYAEQVADCRKLGPDGNAARNALDRDGGQRARAALSATQTEQGERDA